MLIKSMSRKSNGTQLIQYVLRYSLKEKFNQIKSDATVILQNHIRSKKVEDIIKEFKLNESFRIYHRKDNVKLFHDVLSFSPADKGIITKAMMKDIAEKYVELRAKNVLSIIIYHAEKNHDHLHCVTAGVKLDGYSSRISKQQFHHLKIELEKFQHERFSQLSASIINHKGVRTQSKQQIIEAVTNIRQSHKQSVLAILQKAFATAQSQKDFIQRIEKQHVQVYYRNNRLQGVTIEDCKFRFSRLDYDDEKFKELDNHEREQNALAELSDLRKSKSQQVEKVKPVLTKEIDDKEETKLLEELRYLRIDQERSQSPERVIDIDDCDLPKVPSMPGMRTIDDINPYLDMEYDFDDI